MLSAVLAYHVLHRSNQFGEDLRAAKYLLRSGVRNEDILILKSGYPRLMIQFSAVEQPKVGTDDCLVLSTDNY